MKITIGFADAKHSCQVEYQTVNSTRLIKAPGNCKLREFDVGDVVYINNFKGTPLWLLGSIDNC